MHDTLPSTFSRRGDHHLALRLSAAILIAASLSACGRSEAPTAGDESETPPLTPVLRCAPANTDTLAHGSADDCQVPAAGLSS